MFECDITQEKCKKLINELKEYINNSEDSLKVYNLCRGCEDKIKTIGIEEKIDSKTDTIII